MGLAIINSAEVSRVFDTEICRFQQELGEVKEALLIPEALPGSEESSSYQLANKIDLTIGRLLRLLECKQS
jgi:hypothetical protein